MFNNSNKADLLFTKGYNSRLKETWNQRIRFIATTPGKHAFQVNEVSIGLFAYADYLVQGYSICIIAVEDVCEAKGTKHKKYWVIDEEYSYNTINFDTIREIIKTLNETFNVNRILTNIQTLERTCKDITSRIYYLEISNETIQKEAMVTTLGFVGAGKLDVVENIRESLTKSFKIEENNRVNLRVNALFLAMYGYKFEEVVRS